MHRFVALLFCLAAVACGNGDDGREALPSDGAAPAEVGGRAALPAPEIPEDAPTVVFLGDSLAAGLHLGRDEAFPAVLQRRLAKRGRPFHLVNAGVSGSTTSAGLARVDWILQRDPDVVVVELGANDGMRGIPLETVRENLEKIVARVREGGAKVLLLGIRLPPNYGGEYKAGFDALYGEIAEKTGVAFVPGFLEGVGGVQDMNLKDGIHPTPEGHRRLSTNVEDALASLLPQEDESRG